MSDLISQTIAAGATLTIQRASGVLLLNDVSAPIRVKLYNLGTSTFDGTGLDRGVKIRPAGGFDRVDLINESGAPIDVSVFICAADVDVQIATGIHVTVDNADAAPVPVKTPAGEPLEVNFSGTVAPVIGTLNNDDTSPVPVRHASLTTLTHVAAVSVGVAATSLGAADATARKLIFRNDHDTAKVALGAAGVTLANGPIVLLPGDIWEETDAPHVQWYAISDTAATNVQVMRLAP